MDAKLLKQLIKTAAVPSANVNFSDAQSAAKNALVEHFGLEDLSIREMKKHGPAVFALIDEVVEEVLPTLLEERIGAFAEVRTFGRDDIVKFTIRGMGKNRVARGIVAGARGGLYRARRLDDKDLMLPVMVKTVAYQITLEELLSGRRTVAELVEAITRGFTEIVYIEVIKALRTAVTQAPAANIVDGNAFNDEEFKAIIRVISAYGRPVIIGFRSQLEKLANVFPIQNTMPNVPTADLDDIRNRGMVGIYNGTPIVELPNYFMDESNSEWIFNESDLFVVPVDERPVKVAFKGDLYTAEVAQPHGGVEYHAHRIMGVGILFFNHIGIFRDSDGLEGAY
jgi:hypothetical protein